MADRNLSETHWYILFIVTKCCTARPDPSPVFLDEDVSAGVVGGKLRVDQAIDEQILKQAQQELRAEGRLRS